MNLFPCSNISSLFLSSIFPFSFSERKTPLRLWLRVTLLTKHELSPFSQTLLGNLAVLGQIWATSHSPDSYSWLWPAIFCCESKSSLGYSWSPSLFISPVIIVMSWNYDHIIKDVELRNTKMKRQAGYHLSSGKLPKGWHLEVYEICNCDALPYSCNFTMARGLNLNDSV